MCETYIVIIHATYFVLTVTNSFCLFRLHGWRQHKTYVNILTGALEQWTPEPLLHILTVLDLWLQSITYMHRKSRDCIDPFPSHVASKLWAYMTTRRRPCREFFVRPCNVEVRSQSLWRAHARLVVCISEIFGQGECAVSVRQTKASYVRDVRHLGHAYTARRYRLSSLQNGVKVVRAWTPP
jgi:hypothetical protein